MRVLLGVSVLLVFLHAEVRAQDKGTPSGSERIVVRVRFEGNRRYTAEFLKEQIATKEGKPYDPGLIARDERVLRRFFAAVTDKVENEVKGGVEIVFHVLDKVIVGNVYYPGLARVRKKDFEDFMLTRKGRPLLGHSIESDRKMIMRMHHEKGYRFVAVEVYRRPSKKADTEDVVFQVIPGRRVRVKKVILEGAHSIDQGKLKNVLRLSDAYRRKYLGLGKIFDPRFYDRALIDDDRRRMELYYEQEGWLDVKVVYVETRFSDDREYAIIKYRIVEGKRYKVRSFEIEFAEDGLPQPPDRKPLAPIVLEGLSVLVPGESFRHENLSTTRRLVSSRLWDFAYARSTVQETKVRDSNKHLVDIKLTIRAGPKVKLGSLRIYGNKYTRDNVIRRQFRDGAVPGDFLNIESLEAGRTRLSTLRYWNMVRFGDGRGWGLVKDPKAPGEDVYDVELEVEETDTRQFQLGAGVSTDGGAFATVSVTWRNFDIKRPPDSLWKLFAADAFRGGGQQFTISAAPGTTFSNFRVVFSDPALRDSKWSFSTSAWRGLALYDEYDQVTDGFRVRVGRFLDQQFVWHLSIDWSIRQVTIENPDPNAPVNALDQQGSSIVTGFGFNFRRSKRREVDAFLNGNVTTLGFSIYGGPLGGDVDVFKARFEHRVGGRLFKRAAGGWHRYRVAFRTDWATAYGNTPEVPIFERYFLGGRSLRGFSFRGVGPRSNGSPTGGEFLITLSVQYTFPITAREQSGFGLDFVVFVDQGGLSTEFHNFDGDDWRISAGFGFAIGFGSATQPPLLIDFAWPLRDQVADERQVVSVAFERNF